MVDAASADSRLARIADLKHQIELGTYETDAKLLAAMEAFLAAETTTTSPESAAERSSPKRAK